MAYLIDRINEELSKSGYTTGTRRARDWLRSKIGTLQPTPATLLRDKKRLSTTQFVGGMFFFYYDPKTKDSLPYYDRFPLVLPIERYSDGFLGLNLHYIHPKQRIILLDKLSDFRTNSKYDETTKLRLSYDLLRSVSKVYEMSSCIKRYLSNHIQSRFIEIAANEWDIAALLPVERFEKATKNKVWADSRKKY
jgi:hypothetical protein